MYIFQFISFHSDSLVTYVIASARD